MIKPLAIIGYSGHAHTGVDLLQASGYNVEAYCDNEEQKKLKQYNYFIGVGNNNLLRRKIYETLFPMLGQPVNAIHPSSVISPSVKMKYGHFIAPNVSINAL